ncbi:30S ribosomal protein S19e [Candidatus Woesearchaeota archaeon]|nr:30S ribosomal protein S19e [Candidatus Woesearchaeota archaeon]
MITPFDVDAMKLVEKAAEKLKAVHEIKAPEWATFAKTGVHKVRTPQRTDWWHVRVAAVLRTVYAKGPIGVSKIRTKYGGKQNMSVKPSHFRKGSGSVARKALQQLQKAGLIEYKDKGVHKGRKVTGKGRSFLDKIAKEVAGESGKKPKAEAKPQAKEAKTEQ